MYLILKRILFILMISYSSNTIAMGQEDPSLFGSVEYKSDDIQSFKKWNAQRKRHTQEEINKQRRSNFISLQSCRRTKNFKCISDEWLEAINNLKDKEPMEKIEGVNMHLNNISYVTDITNWRQKDYWATISQFLNRDGDCEDYAIAKYYSLKELGFTSDQMRIVVVEDTNLNIAHAVLAVYYDNKIWVLDNQISQIIEHEKIVHYTPLYSINEKAWWLHKKIS